MEPQRPSRRGGIDVWAEPALAELSGLPDVQRVGVALVEGGGRRLLFTASDRPRDTDDTWCHVDAYSPVPLNDVLGTGESVTGPLDELDPRYATYVKAQDGTGFCDIAAVRFEAEGRALGGFILYYGRPQAFDKRQHDDLRDVADRLSRRLHDTLNQPLPPSPTELDPPGSRIIEHEIPPDPAAVGQARRFLDRTLAEWSIDEEIAAQAVLCLSELVTNALVHTFGGCRVRVELSGGVLTTRVHDNGATIAPKVSSTNDLLQGHGHGLLLVDALASRWGRTTDPHASAWFALNVS